MKRYLDALWEILALAAFLVGLVACHDGSWSKAGAMAFLLFYATQRKGISPGEPSK